MPEYRKIDDRGRVTLPAKYMKALNLKPGDAVGVLKGPDVIVVFRVSQAAVKWVRRAAHG